ncbi:MAG: putative metallopeptidase [Candidatus Bathyarchaeia archaeon]
MTEEEQPKYTRDLNLQRAVDDVMGSSEFKGITDFKVAAVFSRGNSPEDREAASCRKIPNSIRTVTGIDFLLVFWRTPWDIMSKSKRHRTIVHELMHVDHTEKGEPKIRRHSGDFCEIPEHDNESAELAKKIPMSSALDTFDTQTKIHETGAD